MPILYKVITSALALTGCAGLIVTGELNLLMTTGGLAVIPGYYRFFRGNPPAPGWSVGLFSVMTLVVFVFDSFVISADIFLAVAHLTITFQAIKSFDLKDPWDHLQVYFVSLLQLIIASELTHSLLFGVVFVLFMGMLVTAMVFSHFMKEGALGKVSIRRPVFLISVLTLATTVLLFIAVPRTSYKFFGKAHQRGIKTAGFSEKVDFGSFGTVKLDPTVIMRIEMDRDVRGPFYWRGRTLDHFDGVTWKNTISDRYRVFRSGEEYLFFPYERGRALEQNIYLEPIDSDIIFGLGLISGLKAGTFYVMTDSASNVYFSGKSSRRVNYTAYSLMTEGYPGVADVRYLQLPAGAGRIADLARQITAGLKTDREKTLFIEQYLKKTYAYSLTTAAPPGGMSPVEDFLFSSKRGYCEHFAASMVVMLRGLGIPSRIVTGFYGGERNEYGDYIIVRQSDAHSWVEALTEETWKRYDPTPAVPALRPPEALLLLDSVKMFWDRYVVGFSSTDQKRLARKLSLPFTVPSAYVLSLKIRDMKPLLYIFALLLVAGVAFFLLFTRYRYRRYGFVTEKYLGLRREMMRRGLRISPFTTSGDIRREAAGSGVSKEVEDFTGLYEEYRFGGKEMGPEERKRYVALLDGIRKRRQV
jgi:transglutaminase-like putative cysteine protease